MASPQVQQKLNEVVTKFDGFLAKVTQRVDEALAETNAGVDELIAQHATDHGPMGAAFSAVQARFRGLATKVDEAYEKIDAEVDELTELDDLNSADWEMISAARDHLIEKRRAMTDGIDLHYYTIEMKKNADWSRRLRDLAQAELAKPTPCSQCGAPLDVRGMAYQGSAACAACHSVNDVFPGTAAGLFYQGLGAHSLAQEASWNEWLAERDAKAKLDRFRHPTEYDRWVYHQAARAYYTRYYQEGLKIYPKFTENIEAAVEAKLKHYTAWDQPVDQQKRALLGQVVEASSKGDAAAMQQLVTAIPHHMRLDDLIECLVERKHFPAAQFLLGVKYDQEGESDPKAQWVAKELADMRKFLKA